MITQCIPPSSETRIKNAPRRRYYTPTEVAVHNSPKDCWISWFGKVFNLTILLEKHGDGISKIPDWLLTATDESTRPLVLSAGKDISDWFLPDGRVTRDIRINLTTTV
jgi:hypothetical protein